ncbi:MAG: hypothetical protein AAB368_08775 [bacterium]
MPTKRKDTKDETAWGGCYCRGRWGFVAGLLVGAILTALIYGAYECGKRRALCGMGMGMYHSSTMEPAAPAHTPAK